MAYTFSRVVSDTKNEQLRRRVVTVEFADGAQTHEATLQFALDSTDVQVKRAFKQYLAELNVTFTPISDIDYTEPAPSEPSAEDVAFNAWREDVQKLVAAKVGQTLGVEVATAAQITTLENRVQTNMVKTEDRYINALAAYANLI